MSDAAERAASYKGENVFEDARPVTCPECGGELERQGKYGQMQCLDEREHQFTWVEAKDADGNVWQELYDGTGVVARA